MKRVSGTDDYILFHTGVLVRYIDGQFVKVDVNWYIDIEYPYWLIEYGSGNWRKVYCHKLMAETFLTNPYVVGNGYSVINHKDGNKWNFKLNNLEWVTQSYNVKHAYYTGLNTHCTPIKTVDTIRDLHERGISSKTISDYTGCSRQTVHNIINNHRHANSTVIT